MKLISNQTYSHIHSLKIHPPEATFPSPCYSENTEKCNCYIGKTTN